ncbi:hypothetical protein BOX15_Mlig008907g1 [Macrostomum lignano]|uniref:Uncharacterized protein n=2 Tax=Macrostomum lignano TaxID=282301 RepID=A0A267DZ45_9PLAT|nr:hypothetical protein BOX15_Mlig018051g1 [Macrostomum lignano]PAA63307.1 hypothetical protein BOX15_Mlig008907g1 [Macrostomum lignano]
MSDSSSAQSTRRLRRDRLRKSNNSSISSDGGGGGCGDSPESSAAAVAAAVDELQAEQPASSACVRKNSSSLPPYVPNYHRRQAYCRCGCHCSDKERWVVHKKRSKCAGVMAATLIGMADSESEEDDIEEKLEKYETQKQRYEFRVKHNFEDEGYRPGPR